MAREHKKTNKLEIEPGATHLGPLFYAIQKISIVLMALILFIAFLGYFGPGATGQTQVENNDLHVKFDSYLHMQNSSHLNIAVKYNPQTINNGLLKIAISKPFFNKISVKSINPQPIAEEIAEGKIIYSFPIVANATAYIDLMFEPETFGALKSEIGLINGNTIKMEQFIYP